MRFWLKPAFYVGEGLSSAPALTPPGAVPVAW